MLASDSEDTCLRFTNEHFPSGPGLPCHTMNCPSKMVSVQERSSLSGLHHDCDEQSRSRTDRHSHHWALRCRGSHSRRAWNRHTAIPSCRLAPPRAGKAMKTSPGPHDWCLSCGLGSFAVLPQAHHVSTGMWWLPCSLCPPAVNMQVRTVNLSVRRDFQLPRMPGDSPATPHLPHTSDQNPVLLPRGKKPISCNFSREETLAYF